MVRATYAVLALVGSLLLAACSGGTSPTSSTAAMTGAPTTAAPTTGTPVATSSTATTAAPTTASSTSSSTAAPAGLTLTAPANAASTGFTEKTLSAPADTPFTIAFDNQDPGIPHNVTIYEGSSATGTPVFAPEDNALVTGPATETYEIPALAVGTYTFNCYVHPATMVGTLTVA